MVENSGTGFELGSARRFQRYIAQPANSLSLQSFKIQILYAEYDELLVKDHSCEANSVRSVTVSEKPFVQSPSVSYFFEESLWHKCGG
jgi:hypothetical protein